MAREAFTASYRGGSGEPLVCIHGFTDTWRTWELVMPALERRHDVLAPTLAGHAGGPLLPPELTHATLVDHLERAMDDAGFETAHLVGNSLGGYLAIELAARGRARSLVLFAPAGGWAEEDEAYRAGREQFKRNRELARAAVPHIERILAAAEGRRAATRLITCNYEHIPTELLAHQVLGVARCEAVDPILELTLRDGWSVRTEQIACPVRVVWGVEDMVLPWPGAAARFLEEWLADADWVVLEGVGHCPQLDVPDRCAELILGFTEAESDTLSSRGVQEGG